MAKRRRDLWEELKESKCRKHKERVDQWCGRCQKGVCRVCAEEHERHRWEIEGMEAMVEKAYNVKKPGQKMKVDMRWVIWSRKSTSAGRG